MQIKLRHAKLLTSHSARELNVLETQTLKPSSGMLLEINDVRRRGYVDDKTRTIMIYQFCNSSNASIGWIAVVRSERRNEIWLFVKDQYRRKGVASRMFDMVMRLFTPAQRKMTYCTHGYHAVSADKFFAKMKDKYQGTVELKPLYSYFT
jgi:GNAT superfamily N-acetyltransferase